MTEYEYIKRLEEKEFIDKNDIIALEFLPTGWRELVVEMMDELDESGLMVNAGFTIVDAKEKYGDMRIYADYNSFDENEAKQRDRYYKVMNIINKYEQKSQFTCGECGNKAIWMSEGWIFPYCDECKKKIEPNGRISFTSLYKNDCDF